MIYELWSVAGHNLLQTFDSEGDAWHALRRLAEKHGEQYLARLALTREDEEGETITLAVGKDLVKQLHATA